jgi:aspartyl-tRNA synthetase
MNRTYAGTLDKSHAGITTTIAGWVQKQRDFGELVFIDVRDRSGIVQVVVDRSKGASDELLAIAKELRSEFVVRIEGEVRERAESTKNPKMPTGEIEVIAASIELLSRAETPPFPIDDEVDAAEDLRLKYRYLDLRRPALTRNLILRDRVAHGVRDYMHRQGFLEIETPILTKSTPEGARDYLVPSRVSKGTFYALPQSPQIFKQLLMVSGLDRYYQIARCFRDEDLRRDRQPEFTQVDIEASFIDEEFVFGLIEGMFAEVFPLAGIPCTPPFERMTWHDAMDRFGTDRPDRRFDMELANVSDIAMQIDLPPFQTYLASGGSVRGLVVPGGSSSFSRSRLDDLVGTAKQRGLTLAWIKFDDQKSSSIKKFLNDPQRDNLKTDLAAGEGDLAFLAGGTTDKALQFLGELRVRLAREEGLIPSVRWSFLWVVDFPLFEWDEESGRFFARHHPFTSPRLADVDKIESDPGATLARAYDVVLNGLELGGGSIRINTPELQSRMFRALGISDDDARERFGFLLDAFRYGAPPHGGVALGFDRMVMLMARADSLREVIAFPKTARAQDLLSEAPSRVDEKQLEELGISIRLQS